MEEMSKAVVTVLGRDTRGIIARVSDVLWKHDVNILDLSQTVMQEMFHMMLVVDISAPGVDFMALRDALAAVGADMGLQIRIQRYEIFDAMHRV